MKQKPINLYMQMIKINKVYNKDLIMRCDVKKNKLTCIIKLHPSEESREYQVKIEYKISDGAPKAWLLDPSVEMYDNNLPHHIYGQDAQGHIQLCVYYPGFKEWSQQMYIAESFIPWVMSWLNTYEYWLITGRWDYNESPRKIKSITRKTLFK